MEAQLFPVQRLEILQQRRQLGCKNIYQNQITTEQKMLLKENDNSTLILTWQWARHNTFHQNLGPGCSFCGSQTNKRENKFIHNHNVNEKSARQKNTIDAYPYSIVGMKSRPEEESTIGSNLSWKQNIQTQNKSGHTSSWTFNKLTTNIFIKYYR